MFSIIGLSNYSSIKWWRWHQVLYRWPHDLQANALPVSYIPMSFLIKIQWKIIVIPEESEMHNFCKSGWVQIPDIAMGFLRKKSSAEQCNDFVTGTKVTLPEVPGISCMLRNVTLHPFGDISIWQQSKKYQSAGNSLSYWKNVYTVYHVSVCNKRICIGKHCFRWHWIALRLLSRNFALQLDSF